MEIWSTEFVGRISLSTESLRIQLIFGRYGYLPYVSVCGIETDLAKFVGRISLSAESLGKSFNRQVRKPALLPYF